MSAKIHKRLERLLMSEVEARKPENLIQFFEMVKGRKATAREAAQFERALVVKRKM